MDCAICFKPRDHKNHIIGNEPNDGTHKYVPPLCYLCGEERHPLAEGPACDNHN